MTAYEIQRLISGLESPTAEQRCLITEIRQALRRGSLDTATKLSMLLKAA